MTRGCLVCEEEMPLQQLEPPAISDEAVDKYSNFGAFSCVNLQAVSTERVHP